MNPLRLPALALAILLGILMCAAGPFNTAWLGGTPLGGGHFPLAPFFISFFLFVGTAMLAAVTKNKPLINGTEQLIIWLFMVIGVGIGYSGLAESFFLNITAPAYYATGGYTWVTTLAPYLPDSWYMNDPAVIKPLYEGVSGGRDMNFLQIFAVIPWSAWIGILLLWGFFIMVAYLTMLCLVNLFGRQWIENERVNFPLLRVPQFMSEALDAGKMGTFLSNKFLLWGIGIPVFIHLINGLSYHYPSIPQLPLLVLAGQYFPKYGLFSGFNKLQLYLVPAYVGFAFLATRQIAFSFWFFYIFGALLMGILYVMGFNIPQSAMGINFGPNLARPAEATVIGSTFVFFLFILWLAREHLVSVFKSGLQDTKVHHGEIIPAAWSMWGAIAGILIMMIWCYWFGMSIGGAVVMPLVFFMIMLVVSRVITQGGLPQFMLTAAPSDGAAGVLGTRILGTAGIAITAVIQKMMFLDVQESLMPNLVHGNKISENTQSKRRFFIALTILLALCVCTAFCSMLVLGYKTGLRDLQLEVETQSVLSIYENAGRLIDAPLSANSWISGFALLGAIFMCILVFCFYKFPWWPLHPLGFLAAYSKSMRILWVCFFLGWLCNYLVLHYGGTSLYRKVQMLFVGLIIGDMLMGGVWAIVSLFSGIVYPVFPELGG
ncbi:DUF6785 family protein [Halodesulfovibrio sp.]|uniref:DUF6785 family protein n=1 Tax=Halodesulfovibrio sp. TaxID=1912772 RepID=UPI0025E0D8FC|nr:DUF6785 family protein [Halodesulfovibrio sp.]MCT4535406.1 hypothetical protein [Halodesulfovibrio sp.]